MPVRLARQVVGAGRAAGDQGAPGQRAGVGARPDKGGDAVALGKKRAGRRPADGAGRAKKKDMQARHAGRLAGRRRRASLFARPAPAGRTAPNEKGAAEATPPQYVSKPSGQRRRPSRSISDW